MAYRLIAIDLDGTLLSPTGHVTDRVKSAIHGVLTSGFNVSFATGRNWTESRAIIDAVGHYSLGVFVGGAMVVDTHTGATLRRSLMASDLAREVSAFLEARGHAVLALQDPPAGVDYSDYLVTGGIELNPPTSHWMRVTASTIREVPKVADHPHDHTIRVGIVSPTAEARQAKAELVAAFGDRIVCHSLYVPAYAVEVIEVFDPAVNKWEGVRYLAEQLGIGPEEVIAIGDDVNDVPMLSQAGLGVAMGNARPEAMSAAKKVIGSNVDEGLAVFLEELANSP